MPDVLTKSVAELPLLVYGRTGLLQEDINNPQKEDLWRSLASPISSVYFDSENMDLYKERIKRSEGAKLFRVRWYGKKPKGDEQIFLELKTHHECWINDKSGKLVRFCFEFELSLICIMLLIIYTYYVYFLHQFYNIVKEGVAVLEKDMPTLLDTSTGTWSPEYAHGLVKKSSPNETEDSIKEATALLLEIMCQC